jgi:5-methylcytosine-specific restriction enzyme subunit McrC
MIQASEVNRNFVLSEYEEKIIEILDLSTVEKIQKTGIVELSRKVSGEFVLKADSKIGFISVQGVQVSVRPRFPVYNVFYFLGLINEIKLDKEKVTIGENSDFLTVLFQSFLQSVESTTKKGLINGYLNQSETSQVLKGRVDFSRQFKKHSGSFFPFEISFDNYVSDIPENQILKKALQISLKFALKERSMRNRAQNILFRFKEVSDIQDTPKWNTSRLNAQYWDSLKLAELIIKSNGFDERIGNVQISGFSIDMYRVFEDFIGKQLSQRVNGSRDLISVQKSLALDTGGIYQEKPDLIWYRDGKPFQVMDTKYKKPEGESQQRDSLNDLRQVISYASLLGLKEAHLIYGVAGESRTIQTRQEGISVFTHGLDLGQSPELIQNQVDNLVEQMRQVK